MSDHFKRFANLQAMAALRGVVLEAIRNDLERHTFIATRNHITHEFPSLDAVQMWLEGCAILAEGSNA
jgi:hypothetical protein